MTHAYVIGLRGIVTGTGAPADRAPTAVAWAADRVLAVGSDDAVRSISRGDSTFLDLAGSAVMPAPDDPAAAERLVRAAVATGRGIDAAELMAEAGLVARGMRIETGTPADLAFWSADPASVPASRAASLRIVAIVRAGGFTAGDEHCGPFAMVAAGAAMCGDVERPGAAEPLGEPGVPHGPAPASAGTK